MSALSRSDTTDDFIGFQAIDQALNSPFRPPESAG